MRFSAIAQLALVLAALGVAHAASIGSDDDCSIVACEDETACCESFTCTQLAGNELSVRVRRCCRRATLRC